MPQMVGNIYNIYMCNYSLKSLQFWSRLQNKMTRNHYYNFEYCLLEVNTVIQYSTVVKLESLLLRIASFIMLCIFCLHFWHNFVVSHFM